MRCPECRVRLVPEGEAKCERCSDRLAEIAAAREALGALADREVRDGIALAREALEKAKKP